MVYGGGLSPHFGPETAYTKPWHYDTEPEMLVEQNRAAEVVQQAADQKAAQERARTAVIEAYESASTANGD